MTLTMYGHCKIYSMAGAEEQSPSLSTEQLCDLILAVGKKPVERDTLYHEIKSFESTLAE